MWLSCFPFNRVHVTITLSDWLALTVHLWLYHGFGAFWEQLCDFNALYAPHNNFFSYTVIKRNLMQANFVKLHCLVTVHRLPHHNHFTVLLPGPLCEPVPENWTLWCKGRLTEADTLTIQLGTTSSRPTSGDLHHPPFFTGWMPFLPPNHPTVSKHRRQLAHSD